MNKIRIKSKADDGDKRAKNAMYISNNFVDALSTVLIGNNIANNAAASVATLIIARLSGTPGNSELWGTLAVAVVIFMFSDMIPKAFAGDRYNTMALKCSGLLRFLMKLFKPLNILFTSISAAFSRLFGVKEVPSITEDELYDIIDTAEEEGVMDEEQTDLFKSALEFSDTRIGEVMTRREDIEAIDISDSTEKMLEFIKTSRHSRLPVINGSLDDIVGILPIRIFLKEYVANNGKIEDLRSLLVNPAYVFKNAKIDDVLEEMRKGAAYLAIVRDDENRTLGVVTIEDFLEELVGEIWDEDDVVDDNFVKLGGNRFKVSAKMTVGEALSKIGCRIDKSLIPDTMLSKPIAVWVISSFGGVPDEGEEISVGNLTITADEVEDNRISDVIIKYMTDEEIIEEKKLIEEDEEEKAKAIAKALAEKAERSDKSDDEEQEKDGSKDEPEDEKESVLILEPVSDRKEEGDRK